ncbi:hypothetical protein ACHAWT_005010 [Skeletonema menzelii]
MRPTDMYHMAGDGGGAGDSYSERSSMARVRASRATSGMSPMIQRQRKSHSQQSLMNSQSIPPPPPLPVATTGSVGSNKSIQDKALITLLAEMRDLERKMNTQAAEYEVERQQLQNTVTQQQQEIKSLQQSNHQIALDKNEAEHTLRKVLTQLDRFSTGCWQFPSNSVKKMSEALHTQLQEWKRTINEEELTPEDEYLENSTMEKMQHLHLEVKKLRAENMALKKEARNGSKKSAQRSATNQNSSSRSAVVTDDDGATNRNSSSRSRVVAGDDDDLDSNLSGMSETILSGMLESERMNEAMKGFLNPPTKSRSPTRRGIGSPTSILKQSGRYESRQDDNNIRRGGGYQQRSKSGPSLPLPRPHTTNSAKKVARFAVVDNTEFECDWGDTENEV